jgi:hypothetical protein
MARCGVRAVAIYGRDGGPHGTVSDLDTVGAVGSAGAEELSAQEAAATEAALAL